MRIDFDEENLSDAGRFPSLTLYGNIDIDEAQKRIDTKLRIKKVMSAHNHPVYHSEKSGWFTDVDDPARPNGLRKIRKCSEEKLWNALASWYENRDDSKSTLTTVFPLWLDSKRTARNASNIKRITASWNSYYLKEPLSQDIIGTPLSRLTVPQLIRWATAILQKNYPVDAKKFNRIFSIIDKCYEYAILNYDLFNITINTWNIAKKRVSHDLLSKPGTPPDDEQVFTDDERRKVWDMVYDDLEHHSRQASTAGLQILFLLETGLRIGECCGLKWPDVRNGRLYIRRQADNDGVREWTKSSCGRRDIPLTSRALKILDDVREFNDAHGYSAEWIFQSGNPKYDYRLSYGAAAHKLRRLCDKLGTPRKSPHKLRKTCISTLLDDPDVNNRTVQRFAGHSDIRTTEAFYNFERRSRAEQAAAIDRALSL